MYNAKMVTSHAATAPNSFKLVSPVGLFNIAVVLGCALFGSFDFALLLLVACTIYAIDYAVQFALDKSEADAEARMEAVREPRRQEDLAVAKAKAEREASTQISLHDQFVRAKH